MHPARPLALFLFLSCTSCSETPSHSVLQTRGGVITAGLSSDNKYAVISSYKQDMVVWDIEKKGLLYTWRHLPGVQSNVIAISFSSDNRRVLTSEKHNLVLWDLQSGRPIQTLNSGKEVHAIALGPEGQKALVAYRDGAAHLIDLSTGTTQIELTQPQTINSVALSRDGRYALTGSADHSAIIWDLHQQTLVKKLRHNGSVSYVGFSPQGNFAITASNQGRAKIWKMPQGKFVRHLNHRPLTVTSARFNDQETLVAVASLPQSLALFDIASGKAIKRWKIRGESAWQPSSTVIYAVGFAKNNNLLTQDSNGFVSWWAY